MSDRKMIYLDDAIDAVAEGLKRTFVESRDVAEKMLNNVPSVQPLTEEDYMELRHRFGTQVESVVRDMVSGRENRWMI